MRSWLNSNWLDLVISALVAIIDIAMITPWILLLVLSTDREWLDPVVPIGAGVIGVVSFWVAREMLGRMWDMAALRMVSLGVWLAMMIVWYGAVTRTWLAAPIEFIDQVFSMDTAAFGLVVLGGLAWWRGISLASSEELFEQDFIRSAIVRTVAAHGLILIVAAFIWDATSSAIISMATIVVPLGFAACLVAATAIQVRTARINVETEADERQPGGGWLGAGAGIAAIVLLVATLIAGTAGRQIWQVLLWPFIQVLRGLSWVLDWIIFGFALVGYFLLLPLFWLAQQMMDEQEEPDFIQETGDVLEPAEQTPGGVDIPEPIAQALQWVVVIVILGLVIWFALRQLRRMEQRRRRPDAGDLRESMWSTETVMSDLGEMLRGLRRTLWNRRERIDLRRAPTSVRDAYQHVLVHAGRQGIDRGPSESALAWSERVSSTEPSVSDPLDDLTERYLRARYADETTDQDVQLAREDWEAIRQRLRRQREE